MPRPQTIFEGDKFNLLNGGFVIVEKYVSAREIKIITNNNYKCTTNCNTIRKGVVQDPLNKNILNVACFGVGSNIAKDEFGNKNIHYTIWYNMIKRCYHGNRPTYEDVYVCDEWLNFQNFANWSKDNYIECYELDKDFKNFGNKIYSPENCLYLPRKINCLFRIPSKKSKLPFGVTIMNGIYCSGQGKERKSTTNLKNAINHHWNRYYNIVIKAIEKNLEFKEITLSNFEIFFTNNYPENIK